MPLPLQDIYSKEETEGYIAERNVTIARVTGTEAGGILRANVYRPMKDGEYPVLVTYGPYGKDWHYSTFAAASYALVPSSQKSANAAWETPSPLYWTSHGYAVVRVDEGGMGQSPGKFDVISKQTIDGFFDSIQWAADQAWSTGKVGLLGLSYYAATQWLVAARHPRGLTAMIPWEGFSDVYCESARHGGIFSNSFLYWWWQNSLKGNQYGYPTPEEKPGRPRTLEGVLGEEELEKQRVVIYEAVAENEWLDQEYNASRQYSINDIEVPFLSVANWGGIALHLRGNVRAFEFASSPLKYMRFIVGRHDLPFYYEEEVENQRSFLDAFLKGEDAKGWTVPGKLPPIDMLIRKGEPAVGNVEEELSTFKRRAEYEWPIARTEYRRLYLTSKGGLSADGPGEDERVFEYNAPEGSVEFATPPMPDHVEITGHPTLHVAMSLSSLDGSAPTEMDVFVTLRHFNAAGKEVMYTGSFAEPTPIVRGWLRASHRSLDTASRYHKPYMPYHPHTSTKSRPVEPDTVYTLDVELWPTNVVIEKSGRLVLEIAAGDDPVGVEGEAKHPPVGVWTHNDKKDRPYEKFRGLNKVHVGGSNESWLVIPVIPASV